MVGPGFQLKTTPPRTPRLTVARPRLERFWDEACDRSATLVEAPEGFGKTTLLTQWRRRCIERGALVAWVSLDAQDEPAQFGHVLLHAMRAASGRSAFETLSAQFRERPDSELDVLTGLLTEVLNLATPTVLILDDAERLPPATIERSLSYLLLNAPPNLHLVIGSRAPLALPTSELLARNALVRLSARELRLELDESRAILQQRFGTRLTLDDCVRLHEVTEGWPIGLQLAAAAIEREHDLPRAVAMLSAREGDFERYFLESLLQRLPPTQREFLTRIAILDTITPELAEHVTGCASAAADLDQLMADTPIFMVAELRDWIRLHRLARDFLLSRFEALPSDEQRALHLRAADWLAARSLLHDAGRHALAAGERERARAWADRALWHLVTRGRLAEARRWLEMVDAADLERNLPLRLASAWVMALGARPAQALELARAVMDDPAQGAPARFEAALIYTCAAAFCDKVGLIERAIASWRTAPSDLGQAVYRHAYDNTLALLAYFKGDPAAQRSNGAADADLKQPDAIERDEVGFAWAIGRSIAGLGHLRAGNAIKADAAVRTELREAELATGRRGAAATLLATVLAAACLERGDTAQAQSLLANRLDVIERTGVPDSIIVAHQTLAGIADESGDGARALDVLDNLRALGLARGIPRMTMVSLAEEVRLHALAARPETALARLESLAAMRPAFRRAEFAPFRPHYDLSLAIARAYVALAMADARTAEIPLKSAVAVARRLGRGRDLIVIMALRAVSADARNDQTRAKALLREAAGLAAIGGLVRVLGEAHPRAVELLAPTVGAQVDIITSPPQLTPSAVLAPSRIGTRNVAAGGMLTPKEAEILGLLDASRSNKEIARSMEVSDETVKWHLKNLYSKLDAGTRRHAVDRARLLGLIG